MARLVFATTLLLIVALSHAARAEERTGSPYFELPAGGVMPLKSTRADVAIAGVIARVRVTQTYQNESGTPIEAVYVFPASTRAAVFGMRMRVGTRTIEAKIRERAAARRAYEEAKGDGKTAGLLEQERANVFRMSVANIMPGDHIETVLDYTELLVPEDGTYAFIYPTVVGPRYTGNRGAAGSARPEESWTANPTLREGEAPPYTWGLSAKLAAGMPIAAVRSPTHTISPRFQANQTVLVEVDDERGGDRDFILEYKLQGEQIETGMLLYPGESESYFLLMMEPPERIAPAVIPPREYVFIIDVSGSMSGFPIETAKATVRRLIEGLRIQDRFNVLTFAGGNAILSEESLYATAENVERAQQAIEDLRGSGGTEILAALKRALELPRTPDMSTTFVVITDGFVDVEPETFGLIRDNLREANLFAFGIGTSVNRLLIEGMARAGMGRPFVVLNPQDAEEQAAKLLRYIEAPLLTDVKVAFEGFEAYDNEPTALPDLFASRPVIVFGKYRGKPRGLVRLSGINASGVFERVLDVSKLAASDDNAALRWLWARDRIARLSDFAGPEPDAASKKEVTRLGLEHNLLTAHTSFVAIDSAVRNHEPQKTKTVRQPVSLPRGVSHCELGGGPAMGMVPYPRTPGQSTSSGGGSGGLGLSGIGAGGGGYGHGYGMGGHGTFGARGERTVPIRAGSPIIMGSLSKDEIRSVIRRSFERYRFCYEKELPRAPNLAGRLVIRFMIAADGSVARVEVKSSTLGDETIEQCVLKVTRELHFPKPHGGGVIEVVYPFNFTTAP